LAPHVIPSWPDVPRHCEERSDEAIPEGQYSARGILDCFAFGSQ